jgi:hypothetical protein
MPQQARNSVSFRSTTTVFRRTQVALLSASSSCDTVSRSTSPRGVTTTAPSRHVRYTSRFQFAIPARVPLMDIALRNQRLTSR